MHPRREEHADDRTLSLQGLRLPARRQRGDGRLPGLRASVDRCLFLPDYFNFLLSGRQENEISIASTSQLLSAARPDWSASALAHFANISQRTGRMVHFDSKTGRFVNDKAADALLRRSYRAPYAVPEKV